MKHYFFSNAFLPTLYFGVHPEISFYEFMILLQDNLSTKDMEKVNELREYIDILNIKRLFKRQPIDTRGNLGEKELETALVELEGFPPSVLEFLFEFETEEERLRHFNLLLSRYLRSKAEKASGFARAFYEHERMLRLSLVAFRCIQNGGDIIDELKYEDPKELFIASLLAQKDTTHFEFPFEFENLTEKLTQAATPIDQYKVIIEHQFSFAEDQGQQKIFSLDFIMAYMMQLIAIENWEATNEQTGIGIIEGMV